MSSSFLAPSTDRRLRALLSEADVVEKPKHRARHDNAERDALERARLEEALDEALKDTFPASDPVSIEQPVAES
jgi:nicotinate phosphoribosyltransferase